MLPNISMTSAFTQRKRGLLYWIIAVWMLAAEDSIGAGFPQNAHFKSKTPNVVIIYADDLGYGDLSCYGATAVQTPRIDALAQNGLMFSDAHAAAATCTPSRFAMLTAPTHGEEKTRHCSRRFSSSSRTFHRRSL